MPGVQNVFMTTFHDFHELKRKKMKVTSESPVIGEAASRAPKAPFDWRSSAAGPTNISFQLLVKFCERTFIKAILLRSSLNLGQASSATSSIKCEPSAI